MNRIFKRVIRNFIHKPGISLINLGGLSIGISCSIFAFLFVFNELNYDRFNVNADRISRVAVEGLIGNTELHQTYTCAPLAQALYGEFPEVESVVRISKETFKVTYHENVFFEKNAIMADSTLFEIFTFPFVEGNPQKALNEPYKMVITESYAKKLFHTENPINKSVVLNDTHSYQVAGIIKDIPENSHFHFSFVVSLMSDEFFRSSSDKWWWNNVRTYILFRRDGDQQKVNDKFPEFLSKYMFNGNYQNFESKGNKWTYYLQPLTSIHLNSDLAGEMEPNGNIVYVRIFLVVGLFILLLACVNYINLTTAQTSNRANEIGIKKVMGAGKNALKVQFIAESILIATIALIVAVITVALLLPLYSDLLGKNLHLTLFSNPFIIPSLLIFGIIVGLLSGCYPAFYLSSLPPVKILKGIKLSMVKNSGIRNFLVVTQFSISIALIASTIIISRQLSFMKSEKLGFNKEQVLIIKNRHLIKNDDIVLKGQFLQSPLVTNVSFSHTIPGELHNNVGFTAEDVNDGFTMNVCVCDESYKEVMGLQMAEGRFFSDKIESDREAIIINEAAARLCGYKNEAVGKIFSGKYKVIGVVKDYHYESMLQKIRPMAMINLKDRAERGVVDELNSVGEQRKYISLKLKDPKKAINFIKNVCDKNSDGFPFEYVFLDSSYDQLYKNEEKTCSLLFVFSALAIFIACLGLTGLSSYTIERRIKEIGIRKVNGSKVWEIVTLLNGNFVKWVAIAIIIAFPITYLVMHKWLENFAYKTSLSWWIFVLTGILALGIALLTVSWQSWKTAIRNPVEALRHE